jgi:hypothetical protein
MIIDAHVHLGSRDSRTKYFGTAPSKFEVEELFRIMDKNSVDKSVIMSLGKGENFDYKSDNNYISKVILEYPDKLYGYIRINPWHKKAIEDFEHGINKQGFCALKLHPESDSFKPNDSLVYPLIETAETLNVPVCIHTHRPGNGQPALVGDLALNFPNVTFIMAHMGMNLYPDAIFVAKVCSNIILESSAQPWIHRIARKVIDTIGVNRLVWGSDCPLHSQMVERLKIESAPLTEDEKNKVMGENIYNILNYHLK